MTQPASSSVAQGELGQVTLGGLMQNIAQLQARIWVDAEIGKLDLRDERQVSQRIAEATRALRMIRDCRHDFPRAVWMHEEIIRRLRAERPANLLPA